MIGQSSSSLIGGLIALVVVLVIVGIIVWIRGVNVVPLNQVHVVTKRNKVNTYDGKGRYWFLKILHSRSIIPKHVLDIEPHLIKLHDIDNLPFGVEISVKVQVLDPQKAAGTLTAITHDTVAKVVEDTVMSAARSIAMERNILDIMKKREEIEGAIYSMVSDALSKLGLAAIIFDIKNIRDIEGADVISSLESVKIAELRKDARISESIHNSQAIQVEVEREKEATVKREQMQKEEEDARLTREQEIAARMRAVEMERLKIEEQKRMKLAEIDRTKARIQAEGEREKRMIEAKGQAEAIELTSKAESQSIKLKTEAEAEGIRAKGLAEAETMKAKAEALRKDPIAGQIKILEILAKAQVQSAAKVADALGENNKIMYLPNSGNLLSNFVPQIDAFLKSGMAAEWLEKLNLGSGSKAAAKKSTSKSTK